MAAAAEATALVKFFQRPRIERDVRALVDQARASQQAHERRIDVQLQLEVERALTSR